MHLFLRTTLLFALLTSSLSAAWQAGAARVDITPEQAVRLSGYGNRTTPHEGVAQRLFAKALVLQWDQEAPLVILTVDNCGVPKELRAEVLQRLLSAGLNIEDARLALHSTHTHCAPMLSGLLPFIFGQDMSPEETAAVDAYTSRLTSSLTDVVQSAFAKLEPARLSRGLGRAGFARNRREPKPTGIVLGLNQSGPVDHDLPVLRVTGADGKLRALFTSYACHCTTLSINETHGDWAGCAGADLETAHPGAVALIAVGCGADQNPFPRRELAHVEQHGAELAAEVSRVAAGELQPVEGPVTAALQTVQLPFEGGLTRADWVARTESTHKATAYHARQHLAMLDVGKPLPDKLDYTLQMWRFGDGLCVVNLPGEVVVDYGLRLKREWDSARLWVNSYTNDVPCYIPSQRVWEEGGYEVATSMLYYGRPTRFASGVEEIIFTALKELIPADFRP